MIADDIRRAGPYTTNGVQTVFAFSFKVFEESNLLVVSSEDGTETELTLNSDYTASLNADQDSNPGGTITISPALNGPSITIITDLPNEQPTVFTNTGGFYPRVLNDALDRVTILIQQLYEKTTRMLLLPFDAGNISNTFVTVDENGEIAYTPISGFTTSSVDGVAVSSVSMLASLSGPVAGQLAVLIAGGKTGLFKFDDSNLSAEVTLDIAKGLYVAPSSASTGASGAWVRQIADGEPYLVEWFGLPTGGSDTAIVQSIEALREDGRDVHFPAGTFLFSNIRVNKPGHWKGAGKATVISHNGANPTTYQTFGIATSGGTRISHMRFTGLHDNDNADAQFHINVSPRTNVVTTPEEMEDFEFDHLWFDDSDTGIRVSFGGTGPTNDVDGTQWWTPKRAHIHDCVFEDVLYQCITPEAHDIVIERCRFKLTSKPGGGYRPFGYFMRILGCNRVTIRDNNFECPYDYPMISTQFAAVDNGLANVAHRAPRHVTIENNRFNGGYLLIYQGADKLAIKNNWFYNNPTTTTDTPPALFYLAFQQGMPIYLGNVEIHDNTGYGHPVQMIIENHSADKISYKRNEIYGNLKTGAAFDIVPIKVTVNSGVYNQDGVTQIKPPMMLDIEGNGIYSNPSMIGSFIQVVGHTTGLHVRLAGNRTSERQGSGTTLISGSALSGTDFQISLGFGTAFGAWVTVSGAVDLSDNAVGDNIAMPTGFYASALAASKFRDEQTVSTVYPATFA